MITDQDLTSGFTSDEPNTAYGVTLGMGIPMGRVDMDFGFEYVYMSREITASIGGDNLDYDYFEEHLRLNMGLTYDFGYAPTVNMPKPPQKRAEKPTAKPAEQPAENTEDEQPPAIDEVF